MDEPKELPSPCSNLARHTQPHTDLFEGVVPLLEVRGVRGELLVVGESPREGVPLALRLRQPNLQLVHPATLLVQGGLQRRWELLDSDVIRRGCVKRTHAWAEPGSRNPARQYIRHVIGMLEPWVHFKLTFRILDANLGLVNDFRDIGNYKFRLVSKL